MASAYITARRRGDAVVFVVRYRAGGRKSRLQHAGTCKTYNEAERLRDQVRIALAAGEKPERETTEVEPRVYFARLGKLIKIGISIDPVARCRDLNAELLHVEVGGRERERELHEQFASSRESGEWFWESPGLRAYLRWQLRAKERIA